MGECGPCKVCIPGVSASLTRRKRELWHAKCAYVYIEIRDLGVKLPETCVKLPVAYVQLPSGLTGNEIVQVLQSLLSKFLRHLMLLQSMPNQCFCLDQTVQCGTYLTFKLD